MEEKQIKTTVGKGNTAKIKTKMGGEYSYKYTDLAQIHEHLESIGARYYQYVDRIDSDDYIMTVPIIGGKELNARRGVKIVDANLMGNDNPAQKQGSATTYARRYSLLMAFGLATEDGDGEILTPVASKPTTKEEAEKYQITFGKHSGKSLKEILEEDEKYIDWLFNNDKTDPTINHCISLLTGKPILTPEEKKEQLDLLVRFNELINLTKTKKEEIYEYFKVKNNTEMTKEQFIEAIRIMEKKLEE